MKKIILCLLTLSLLVLLLAACGEVANTTAEGESTAAQTVGGLENTKETTHNTTTVKAPETTAPVDPTKMWEAFEERLFSDDPPTREEFDEACTKYGGFSKEEAGLFWKILFDDPDEQTFTVTCAPEKTEVQRGTVAEFTLTFTNTWDEDHAYQGVFRAEGEIYPDGSDTAIADTSGQPIPDDATLRALAPGDTVEDHMTIEIPEDAPLGSYTLKVTYNGKSYIFESAFTVTE